MSVVKNRYTNKLNWIKLNIRIMQPQMINYRLEYAAGTSIIRKTYNHKLNSKLINSGVGKHTWSKFIYSLSVVVVAHGAIA